VKNKLNKHIIVVVRRENRQEVLEYSPYRGELQRNFGNYQYFALVPMGVDPK
jgi:hypothetical protein